VGAGNIRIATAIDLLENYAEQHPFTDPYLIKHYQADYGRLVYDLTNTELAPQTTVAFATLMLEEANDWFTSHAADWATYDTETKEGLLVFYYKVGREAMDAKLDHPQDRITFDTESTPIISEYLENYAAISQAIEFYGGEILGGDEAHPVSLTIGDAETNEGGIISFVVNLSEAADQDVTFLATTHRGSTSSFEDGRSPDYDGVSKYFTIPAGEMQLTVRVQTDQDSIYEETEVLELRISDPSGAVIVDRIGYGTIRDDDPDTPQITLANFSFDLDRISNGELDPRVSYSISHSGDEDLTGVKVRWYATANGELDGNEIYLGYESAGTLRVGEVDSEFEDLEALAGMSGDWSCLAPLAWATNLRFF